MADFKLSANIEVRKQAPLDDRLAKMTKADLIKSESWASDNGTYYVYKYMIVGTADGLFMLMDVNKLLDEDFSGWKRIGNESIPTGGLTEDEVKDLLDVILADYVQKEEGKGLSTNDYTNGDKAKLDGLKNYDDTNIKAQLEGLQNSLNVLVEGNATSAIESFNEIVSFLASIEDKQTLSGIINGINQSISNVESNIPTKISELDNDKGFITLNEVPKQDLSEYAKKSDIPTDYLKEVPEEYITETELSNKGYIAANEVNALLDEKVDKVDGKQLSTEDFTTLLKNKLDGLSNYDDTEISQAVSKLRADLDALVSGDTTTAIKTFNEVVAFLDGISDTEDLSGIIASIEQQIADKQDVISDLATIREGAAKGATAIQEHQDLSGKQDKLVSGTNIKTINGQDILGEGDIVIEGNSEANVGAIDTDDFVEERKVKDAKDLETGENIYFKGHAKATYMSDGTTVEDAINQSMGSESEKLVVSVSGITEGFTVYVMSEDGDVIGSQTTNYKTYRIKEGVRYYVMADEVAWFIAPNQTEVREAYAYAENEITMEYIKLYITTIRINQTISDPATMITRIVDEGGIEAIRANSHRYTGSFADGVMRLKQLDDNDGTKYLDSSDADLTTLGTDVWMALPQFYWKCEKYATDIWDFSVAYWTKPDDTFKEWDGKDLIGVYEAYVSSSKVYSVSGVDSTENVSQSSFKNCARNRSEGFTLVKWKHHCMMAMLYYTMYGNTNCQDKIGKGTDSNLKTTGATNSLGMNDTVAGGNGDSNSINFWGLENWWGNKFEWMDNIVVDARVWKVTEDDGTVRRAGYGGSSDGYISKLLLGENIDLIPTTASGSETTGFCDSYVQLSSNDRVALRSGGKSGTTCGVAYVHARHESSTKLSSDGSRLAFRGEIVIEP